MRSGLVARRAAGNDVVMAFDVRPADVFEDVRQILGPKNPGSNVCWCLSYRVPSRLNRELVGTARGGYVAGASS